MRKWQVGRRNLVPSARASGAVRACIELARERLAGEFEGRGELYRGCLRACARHGLRSGGAHGHRFMRMHRRAPSGLACPRACQLAHLPSLACSGVGDEGPASRDLFREEDARGAVGVGGRDRLSGTLARCSSDARTRFTPKCSPIACWVRLIARVGEGRPRCSVFPVLAERESIRVRRREQRKAGGRRERAQWRGESTRTPSDTRVSLCGRAAHPT